MSMDFSTLFGGLLFSAIGLASLQIGRKRESPGKIGLGLVMMVMPFFADGWLMWTLGIAGCAGIYFLP